MHMSERACKCHDGVRETDLRPQMPPGPSRGYHVEKDAQEGENVARGRMT